MMGLTTNQPLIPLNFEGPIDCSSVSGFMLEMFMVFFNMSLLGSAMDSRTDQQKELKMNQCMEFARGQRMVHLMK